jgi:hypothetical protein
VSYPKTRFGTCSKCGKSGFVSTHHRFKQKKWRRDLYGDLLDDPKNLVYNVCGDCHKWLDSFDTWNEREFCQALGLKPISKGEGLKCL